jgi:hypothetical protein
MLYVPRAQQASTGDLLADKPDDSAIHDDLIPGGKIAHGKFVLGRYLGYRNILLSGESNGFPSGELGESYEDIVFGIDPEYFFGCHFFSPAASPASGRFDIDSNVAFTVSTVKQAPLKETVLS